MGIESNEHHLVLGQLNDFLTGRILADTHDERYRQKIAKILVRDKGYQPADILSGRTLELNAGDKKARMKIDFLIQIENHIVTMIKYAPGSLVTRRLSTLALSRIIEPYQIPIAVFTNGEDAEIIDGHTGCLIAQGLNYIPSKKRLVRRIKAFPFKSIDPSLYDKASRIAYACEVDGACPCDTDICVIND